MNTPPLRQGTIVRAYIIPQRGITKMRYGVVYTPDHEIDLATLIELVAISGSCYPDDPDHIPLPWQADGQVMTRLRKPCAIALNFTDVVPKAQVAPTWGYLPREKLAEMLSGLKRLGRL